MINQPALRLLKGCDSVPKPGYATIVETLEALKAYHVHGGDAPKSLRKVSEFLANADGMNIILVGEQNSVYNTIIADQHDCIRCDAYYEECVTALVGNRYRTSYYHVRTGFHDVLAICSVEEFKHFCLSDKPFHEFDWR